MIIDGYGILEKRDNLKLLCFRGGFSLKGITSEESLSGGDILNKLKKELGVSMRELKISPEDTYTLCTLSLKKHSSLMERMGDLLRPYIGGILLVTPS